GLEGRPADTAGPGRDVDPAQLEAAEDLGPALAQPARSTQHRIRRHPVAVVAHLDGLDALVAELADRAADGDAARSEAGLLLDDEAGDPLGRPRRQRHDRGPLAVGDPHLGAVDDVFVAVARRPA